LKSGGQLSSSLLQTFLRSWYRPPPGLLGLIHGDIGIFQENTFTYSIIGIDSDADTRCHNELIGVNEEGFTNGPWYQVRVTIRRAGDGLRMAG
jgi:hypothetical protein